MNEKDSIPCHTRETFFFIFFKLKLESINQTETIASKEGHDILCFVVNRESCRLFGLY
jgi:hypothetical protein